MSRNARLRLPPLTARDDETLVAGCLRGDELAWHELIDKYGRLVYSIAHHYKLDQPEKDDVFQNVFMIVLKRLDTLQNPKTLPAWLMTITHREAQRVGKAQNRFVELDESLMDHGEPALEQVHRLWVSLQVQEALAQLESFSREFIIKVMADPAPSYAEIARHFGMPVGSVGPTRARCFKKLETILKRMGVELG